jgi:hypothetical protein
MLHPPPHAASAVAGGHCPAAHCGPYAEALTVGWSCYPDSVRHDWLQNYSLHPGHDFCLSFRVASDGTVVGKAVRAVAVVVVVVVVVGMYSVAGSAGRQAAAVFVQAEIVAEKRNFQKLYLNRHCCYCCC